VRYFKLKKIYDKGDYIHNELFICLSYDTKMHQISDEEVQVIYMRAYRLKTGKVEEFDMWWHEFGKAFEEI